jgi:hypothetical protein
LAVMIALVIAASACLFVMEASYALAGLQH